MIGNIVFVFSNQIFIFYLYTIMPVEDFIKNCNFLGTDDGKVAETCLPSEINFISWPRISINMSYAEKLQIIPEELRRVFRKYENIRKKLINIKWSSEFNSICLKENIMPNFSRIRHHNRTGVWPLDRGPARPRARKTEGSRDRGPAILRARETKNSK